MNQSFGTIVRKPSAFLPLAMSLTALALLGGAYIFALATGQAGLERQQDEGAIAHLWQLLMAGQLPVLIFFAIKWLPRAPRQTLYVLALQAGAAVAAMAPVYLYESVNDLSLWRLKNLGVDVITVGNRIHQLM